VRLASQRGHEVHGAFHEARLEGLPCAWHALDRGDPLQAVRVLGELRPEVVVDCAAWTDVDGCERDPLRAERDNAQGARHVAEGAARAGARVVHVGTDFVFDGTASRPYTERDAPNPRSVYARTKLAAERAVLDHAGNAVLRSAVVFGWHPKKLSFTTWLLRELRAGKQVRIVHDQWGTPTLADALAATLLTTAERGAAGLFHAAGGTCVTREAFARATAAAFGLDPGLVVPIASAEFRQAAARPAYACLDSSKAVRELGHEALTVEAALARLRAGEPG
jgi:dTDP-4-dehydrorhamnose reductase